MGFVIRRDDRLGDIRAPIREMDIPFPTVDDWWICGPFFPDGRESPLVITFSRGAYDDLIHAAYDGRGAEVCGILAGHHDDSRTTVEDTYAAENVADSPEIRYYIDPEEQLQIIESIEDRGLDVAGFYHSHPTGPPRPSATDAERATWPGLSYVIVALDGYPYLGSWRWRDGAFEQETVRVA